VPYKASAVVTASRVLQAARSAPLVFVFVVAVGDDDDATTTSGCRSPS